MFEDVSPTVARRHLRLALREAREAADLTQSEVAEEMEWSLSKVIRIENGDVRISPNDLRPLLTLLQVKDKQVIADLLAYAKVARSRQRGTVWYQTPEFREHMTMPLLRLVEYEIEAVEIRYYQVFFFPGMLQTAEYANANLAIFEDDIPAATRLYRAEARERRRAQVFSRLGELRIFALFDESVFRRPLGGPEVFVEQLRALHELAVAGQLHVRMIPFASRSAVTNNASFEILTLRANDPSSDVLYRETGISDEIVEGGPITVRHHQRFDKIWNVAATEEDTIDFMSSRIKELQAQIRDENAGTDDPGSAST